MKSLITAAAIGLMATTASASEFCEKLADVGAGVFASRLVGIPMEVWLDQINPDGANVEWLLVTVFAAYEVETPIHPSLNQMAIDAFEMSVYHVCMNNTGANM